MIFKSRLSLIKLLILSLAFLAGCDRQNQEAISKEKTFFSTQRRYQGPDTTEQDALNSPSLKALRISATFPEPGRWKKPLRILYVGLLDTDRAKDFTGFLKQYFAQVETAPYKEFTDPKSNGFDVTILDYDGTNFDPPRSNISQSFSRPMITLGVPGAFVCSKLTLKTGYL